MPREYRMVSLEPVDLDAVVTAARDLDPGLRPRLLFDGWAVQLLGDQDVAVLTVEASRRLDDLQQAEQLVGPLPITGPVWWARPPPRGARTANLAAAWSVPWPRRSAPG